MSTWHERLTNRKQIQQDAERIKKVEVNDISFPALGGGGNMWGAGAAEREREEEEEEFVSQPKPKMSELVAAWDAKQTEDAELEAFRASEREQARKAAEYRHRPIHVRHYRGIGTGLGNTHSRDEDTYYEEDNDEPPSADTSDNWRMVERTLRRPKKSAVERALLADDFETAETDEVWRTEEETVWGRT